MKKHRPFSQDASLFATQDALAAKLGISWNEFACKALQMFVANQATQKTRLTIAEIYKLKTGDLVEVRYLDFDKTCQAIVEENANLGCILRIETDEQTIRTSAPHYDFEVWA